MKYVSKATLALEKQFKEAYFKDLQTLIGKCYMLTEQDGDDEDELADPFQEFVMVERLDEEEGLIGSTVYLDEEMAEVTLNTSVELVGNATPCSKSEFVEALKRAQGKIAKKIEGLKPTQEEPKDEEN